MERYKQEKFDTTQAKLDNLKQEWLEMNTRRKALIAEGRLRKYGNTDNQSSGQASSQAEQNQNESLMGLSNQDNPTISSSNINTNGTSLSFISNATIDPSQPTNQHLPMDDLDDLPPPADQRRLRTAQDGEEQDDQDEDGEEEGLDPLLHVHSRWLLQLLFWNDGKTSYTLPYHTQSQPELIQDNQQNLFITPPSLTSPPPQPVLSESQGQHNPSPNPTNTKNSTANPIGQDDELTAWRNRNRTMANILQLGLNQDIGYLSQLESQRQFQREIFQNVPLQSTPATTQLQPQPQPPTQSFSFSQPSVGYPELSLSIEEVNGAIRLCDNLHKKVILASTTPQIIQQTQAAHIQSITTQIVQSLYENPSTELNLPSFSYKSYNNRMNQALKQIVAASNFQQHQQKNQHQQQSQQIPTENENPPLKAQNSIIDPHFTYFTLEFDSSMSVVGIYKRSHPHGEYHSPSCPIYPNTRQALLDIEEAMIYQ